MNEVRDTFSFGSVKEIIADVFGAKRPGDVSTLLAKINGLQRNGFVPEKPGRGKVIRYSVSDIYDLCVALSVAEFGLPTRIIAIAVTRGSMDNDIRAMSDRFIANDQYYLVYYPSLFYENLTIGENPIMFNGVWESQIGHRVKFSAISGNGKVQVGFINLSGLIARIMAAIAQHGVK